jgi:hypothetical protein
MEESRIYAVITGDIVGSTRLKNNQGGQLAALILAAGEKTRSHFAEKIHAEIDIFRGDSWQLVISDPAYALRIGLFLRASLQTTKIMGQMDTRFSIGFGEIDYLPEKQISTGSGDAFSLSGKGLENCKKPVRLTLQFPYALQTSHTLALNLITQLIDLQVQRWTQKQAEAVSGALIGLTQQEIAENWVDEPVSQQAISQHLEGAGWSQIRESLDFFEASLPAALQPVLSYKS